MADTAAPVLCGPMSAYTQFGYSYPAASQVGPAYCHPALLVAGQPTTATSPPLGSGGGSSGVGAGAVSPGGGGGGAAGVGVSVSSCCESGRPLVTDPVSGQSVCSCQYDSARLALSSYPRLSSYGAPYPSTDQNPYPSIGVDSSAFYSPLSNPYALKDSGTTAADMGAWTSAGLQPTTGYYPYDPTLAAYGYGAGYDLAARRKNATRESTATLKAWLNEHKKNPYPTKGEKIMLAIITKMTLTQVSTWFANARRRLKKENKMTWEPKNKTDDDDDAIVSDGDDKDKDDLLLDDKLKDSRGSDKDPLHHVKAEHALDEEDELEERRQQHHPHHAHLLHGHHGMLKDELAKDCGVPLPATKPKIWSLADTAACKTPPPPPAAQQPWLVPAAAPAPAGAVNSFALPSPASSAGAAAPYSRYGGLISAPYGGGGGGGGGSSSGFPEVQTDTPPQTPPNMKLPSVAVTGNLLAPSSGASCFGGGGGGSGGVGGMGLGGMGASSSGYGGHHANAAFLGGFSRQQQQQPQSQSPHKEQRGLAAMAGVKEPAYPQHQHHHHHQHPAMMAAGVGVSVSVGGGQAAQGPAPAEGTAFKPFYKGYVRGEDAAADALEQCVRAGVCDGSVRGGASPD